MPSSKRNGSRAALGAALGAALAPLWGESVRRLVGFGHLVDVPVCTDMEDPEPEPVFGLRVAVLSDNGAGVAGVEVVWRAPNDVEESVVFS
eukprot:jgi/Psemu1/30146/gm1.30146_g